MKYLLSLMIACLAIGSYSHTSKAQNDSVISRQALVDMFEGMEKNTSWDVSKPLLWGYYFTDASPEKLDATSPELEKQGYRVVGIFQADKEYPNEPDLWYLHVEKVEIHDVDSLDQRNHKLHRFANKHGLDSYDGMDAGPVAEQ